MFSGIRPSTPADAPAIVALYAERRMFGHFDPQYLSWKYWLPRTDWAGPRSFVLAQGNDLIAHAAIIPSVFAWESRRARVLQMIDWVARAGSGGGVALMKHLARISDALLGIGGGPETQQLLPHLGFRTAGTVAGYARPLHPLRLLRSGVTRKLLPRMARAALRRSAAEAPEPQWRVRRLAGEELNQLTPVFPRPVDGVAVTERSTGQLSYMLCCPSAPMQLFAVENAGRVRGYFLLASVAGQVRLADCWIDSQELADWRALLLCAVAQAQEDPQAAEAVAWASDPLLAQALRGCGFHARFESPIRVRASATERMPQGTLRVQMLDCDEAFLYMGRSEYWG